MATAFGYSTAIHRRHFSFSFSRRECGPAKTTKTLYGSLFWELLQPHLPTEESIIYFLGRAAAPSDDHDSIYFIFRWNCSTPQMPTIVLISNLARGCRFDHMSNTAIVFPWCNCVPDQTTTGVCLSVIRWVPSPGQNHTI